jgi:hypothetical protein
MPILRFGCAFLLLSASLSVVCQAQNQSNFPTANEIQLMVTQTDRAVQQYKPLIAEQERLLGKKAQESAAKDREVVQGLEMAIKAFGKNPQGFNSPLGFSFFEWIDDADRNALLCATGAATEATTYLIDGNASKAGDLAHLAQSCSDAATLLYTVSENAGGLYTRYVQGQAKLAEEGVEVAQKCTDVLKKSGVVPKKN